MTNEEARAFLDRLDASENVTVYDDEAEFIESNIARTSFTQPQLNWIEKMRWRYGARL